MIFSSSGSCGCLEILHDALSFPFCLLLPSKSPNSFLLSRLEQVSYRLFRHACELEAAMKVVNFSYPTIVGFRSVPLKNGYSEDIELASLLVYCEKQQIPVGAEIVC